jgi:serine/threonine protein kinase
LALIPGARLGPYEILSPLGAGGMGEVYKARDTKLGRDVAIKILPDAFVSDPERVARFQREAKTGEPTFLTPGAVIAAGAYYTEAAFHHGRSYDVSADGARFLRIKIDESG